jgi:O-antigen/teichoic acid export membrane protein
MFLRHSQKQNREYNALAALWLSSGPRSLRTNFVWNAAGTGLFAMSQWCMLIVFAKLGSPTVVGQLVYGIAIAGPLYVTSSLQLRSVQATDCNSKYRLGQYLGLRSWTTLVALMVTLLIAGAIWNESHTSAIIVAFWGLCKVPDSASDALYGLFQQRERMDYVGISLISRAIGAIIISVIVFKLSHSAQMTLGAIFIVWTVVFAVFDYPMANKTARDQKHYHSRHASSEEGLRPCLRVVQLKMLFLEALPLGVVACLLALQVQIPRYVVAGRLHVHELGLFSAASYLTFVGSIIVNALGAPACVRLAQYHATGQDKSFGHLLRVMLLISSALGMMGVIVAWSMGRWILTILYTSEYSSMRTVLTIVCAGTAVSLVASCFGYAMTALQQYRIQVPIFICVVIVSLISCWWLTKTHGLNGAAISVVIGSAVQLALSAGVVMRKLRKARSRAESQVSLLEAQGSVL